jgi:hypothetical protein
MQKQSLILWFGWVFLALVALVSSYWVFIVREDFQVLTTTSCDVGKETCFVYRCDSSNTDNATDLCLGAEDKAPLYYTYIFKKKSQLRACEGSGVECTSLVCEPGEEDCERIVCSDETLKNDFVVRGVECSVYIPPAPEVKEVPVEEVPKSVEAEAPVFPSDLAPSTEENMPAAPVESSPSLVPSGSIETEPAPVSPIPYDPSTDTSL